MFHKLHDDLSRRLLHARARDRFNPRVWRGVRLSIQYLSGEGGWSRAKSGLDSNRKAMSKMIGASGHSRRWTQTAWVALAALIAVTSQRALATWSIIAIDTQTHEIAVGAATCVPGIDLRQHLPVVLVDVGAACAQSLVDVTGENRKFIHDGLLAGTQPALIITTLALFDSMHENRQYGIATTGGLTATFTGSETGSYRGGVTGQFKTIVYAIQGNVLTGEPVVTAAEQALRTTVGALPVKLMAAMEAARQFGGDGRCSCTVDNPTVCGSPPASFDKSAHVGFMIVTRPGDTDGDCNGVTGCATGDYYLNLNIADQGGGDVDPVFQLREAFDAWRAALVGLESSAIIEPPAFPADGTGSATMTITVRDYRGQPVSGKGLVVTVEHDKDSDNTTTIGPVLHLHDGGGVFLAELTGSQTAGQDRFVVTVDDSIHPAVLTPQPTLFSLSLADRDQDGDVDGHDALAFTQCIEGPVSGTPGPCDASDFDRDGRVDLCDFGFLQREYTAEGCVRLEIDEPPQSMAVPCGSLFRLRVTVLAEPPPVYQWFLNGEAIPGARSSDYFVAAATGSDFGTYRVQVTNTCGAITVDDIVVVLRGLSCP